MRKTVGSCDSLPPSRTTLMSSFTIPHRYTVEIEIDWKHFDGGYMLMLAICVVQCECQIISGGTCSV